MICHQTLGSEDLAARSFPSALTHLKIAYEIGRSAGNTVELPSIAYDFGIAAMYVIHLAPSPSTSKETTTSSASSSSSSSSSSASLASPSSSPVSRRSTTSPLFKPSPLSSKTAAGEDENSNVNKESPYTSHPLRPIAHSPATHAAGVLDPGEKAVAVAAAAAEREKVERIIEEAIAAVEGDNSGSSSSSDSEDEDGEGKTRDVERKRFNFRRFRSVSYSKFDKFKAASSKSTTSTTSTAADTASPAPPVSPSSPEATSSTSTSTAAAGVPPKRPYVKAKSFGARLRGGGGSKTPTFSPPPTLSTPGKSESLPVLPSPPLTPPVGMSAQVTESGITTNDISLAASALSYLFRLVSTKQGLPELQVKTPHVLGLPFDDEDNEKLWGGEMKLSDEDLVVGTPQILSSQVLFKKA